MDCMSAHDLPTGIRREPKRTADRCDLYSKNVQPEPVPPPGIYMPGGVHITYTQAAPGFRVPLVMGTSGHF